MSSPDFAGFQLYLDSKLDFDSRLAAGWDVSDFG